MEHANAHEDSNTHGDTRQAPIFVLSTARSGSTLLRFILDSHPDIACPPETNVALACRYLVNTWRVLESGRPREDAPAADGPKIPEYILAATREAIDAAFGHYLQGTGKSRWCDKSPDSCWDAELLGRLYPEAKFICLYRHCMDVIVSGAEARPWGLRQRIGFETDSFAAQYPGNMVAAGGAYWQSHVQKMMAFEESHPERCHRVRYEDMVTAPEETAAAIFSFLEVKQVPGITEECFQVKHEGNNPGDKKIWFTSKVTSESMGRGIRVPASWLPPRMRDDINQLLEKLEYRIIDNSWNEAVGSIDPRDGRSNSAAHARSQDNPELSATVGMISSRLTSWSDDDLSVMRERWPFLCEQDVKFIVQGADGHHQALRWSSDDAGLALQPVTDTGQHEDGQNKPVTLIADPATWQALLAGAANLDAEKKAGRLRHLHKPASRDSGWDELHAVGTLLGLSPLPARAG
jgi:protein-tyrosine sulfotransferase